MTPKVLVVLTSHDKLGDSGIPSGWSLPEFAHPYDVLIEASCELTVASPAGGVAPLDPKSAKWCKDASSVNFLNNRKSVYENTIKLSEFFGKADQFDAILFPGGHGPMFDLAIDSTCQGITAEFASKGKVVAAVSHGQAALVSVELPSGELLLKGKRVTGFSNAEEDAVDLSKFMPFMLETKLNEVSGGNFVKADNWQENIVVEENIITGQNPASAKGVGEAILKALGK